MVFKKHRYNPHHRSKVAKSKVLDKSVKGNEIHGCMENHGLSQDFGDGLRVVDAHGQCHADSSVRDSLEGAMCRIRGVSEGQSEDGKSGMLRSSGGQSMVPDNLVKGNEIHDCLEKGGVPQVFGDGLWVPDAPGQCHPDSSARDSLDGASCPIRGVAAGQSEDGKSGTLMSSVGKSTVPDKLEINEIHGFMEKDGVSQDFGDGLRVVDVPGQCHPDSSVRDSLDGAICRITGVAEGQSEDGSGAVDWTARVSDAPYIAVGELHQGGVTGKDKLVKDGCDGRDLKLLEASSGRTLRRPLFCQKSARGSKSPRCVVPNSPALFQPSGTQLDSLTTPQRPSNLPSDDGLNNSSIPLPGCVTPVRSPFAFQRPTSSGSPFPLQQLTPLGSPFPFLQPTPLGSPFPVQPVSNVSSNLRGVNTPRVPKKIVRISLSDVTSSSPGDSTVATSDDDSSPLQSVPPVSDKDISTMNKYIGGSLQFISTCRKRRKNMSASSSAIKRRRQCLNISNYGSTAQIRIDRKHQRYQSSPDFAARVCANTRDLYSRSFSYRERSKSAVWKKKLYHSYSPYRRRSIERSRTVVKRMYSSNSPFRRKYISAAVARYNRICNSARKLKRLREEQRSMYSSKISSINSKRRKLYQSPARRSLIVRRCVKWKRQNPRPDTINKAINLRSRQSKGLQDLIERRCSMLRMNRQPRLQMVKKGTAEDRRLRLLNWKRYKINQLLAYRGRDSDEKDGAKTNHPSYGLKKLKVSRMFEQVLVWQRKQRKLFYRSCAKIRGMYEAAEESRRSANTSDVSAGLALFYGGNRYHVASHERLLMIDKSPIYSPYLDVFPDEAEGCSEAKKKLRVRTCGPQCDSVIPLDWATKLHNNLRHINGNFFVQRLLHNVHLFEQCDVCDTMTGVCASRKNCTDSIAQLLAIEDHFAGVRTVLCYLYEMRRAALELHLIELLFMGGTYFDYVIFKRERFPDTSSLAPDITSNTNIIASDEVVIDRYGPLIAKFNKRVRDSMEIYECIHCLRLVSLDDVRVFEVQRKPKYLEKPCVVDMMNMYENHFGRRPERVLVCKKCYELSRGKNFQPSSFSYANGMWPAKIPVEILRLNVYERLFISLAKSYQRIVKLYPMRFKGPGNTLTRGIKGLAIHLPLPQGTVDKVTDILKRQVTLPSFSNFVIQLDSMPNVNKKLIFRSLVDMTSVVEALLWLKEHNELYKNVIIDQSFLILKDIPEGDLPQVITTTASNEDAYVSDAIVYNDSDMNKPVSNEANTNDVHGTTRAGVKPRKPSYFDDLVNKGNMDSNIGAITRASDAVDISTGLNVSEEAGGLSQSGGRQSDAVGGRQSDAVGVRQSDGVGVRRQSDAVGGRQSDAVGVGQSDAVGPDQFEIVGTNNLASGPSDTITVDEDSHVPNVKDAVMYATQSLVAGLRFPIPYTIPYKQLLATELCDTSSMVMRVDDELLEEYSVIEMEKSVPKTQSDLELFAMKPLKASPLAWEDPYCDVASFPHLYPEGKFGLFHPRKRMVTTAFYIEHCFRISDPRFRRDLPFLFDCAIRKDMKSIDGSIYTMLNCGRFGKVTAGVLKEGVKGLEKSTTLERNVTNMLGKIVGTPQYWMGVRRDLEALVQEFGSATYFLTLSCAEYKCEDYKEFLIFRNFDIPNAANVNARSMASIDPLSVSLHFQKRFNVFWDEVLMTLDGPLGLVEHFYIKKEYQQRGAPHMHILLWIRDAPVHGKAKDEDVLEFVTSRISCSLPDVQESPVLHNLVMKNQSHNCTKSCIRTKTVKGKFYCSYCRFGYPREVCEKARLNSTEKVLEAKVSGSRRIKLYTLPRRTEEVNINDYNPAILYMWKSNMDIQFIEDVSMSLTYYMTFYVCKHEKQLASTIAEDINQNLSAAGMAKKMACKMLASRQLGAHEAADKVLRFPMYKMSDCVKFTPFYLPGEERRRLKPKTKIDTLGDESTDVFCNSFQNTYYPNRPSPLDNLCAYEVMQWYEVRYNKLKKDNALWMDSCKARFARRQVQAVIRTWQKTKSDDLMDLERFCFQMVALFKPWRKPEELLMDMDGNVHPTYRAVLDAIRDRLPILQRYESIKTRFQNMIETADNIRREAQKKLEAMVDNGTLQPLSNNVGDQVDLDLDICQQSASVRKALTKESVQASYDQLNDGQKGAFDQIMEGVSAFDVRPFCASRLSRLFVSGVGGTGKSFLIMALRQHLEFYFSTDKGPSVLVAAPTGVAAINVDGLTIHKLLKLPVSKTKQAGQQFFALNPQDAKILRMLFANVRLLIIDEVSMLSNIYLTYVHRRLNEILVDEELDPIARFGNLNVLLLGDLLQLPPVNAPHVFARVSVADSARHFQSLGCQENLWSYFDFVELTQNMRQRDDLDYAMMLDRIRIGSPTSDDLEALRSKLIDATIDPESEWDKLLDVAVAKFVSLMESDSYVLCLMPVNVDVNAFNSKVMESLKLQPFKCLADDKVQNSFKSVKRRGRKSKLDAKTQSLCQKSTKTLTVAETGGLEEELVLAVGARVMLRRNIDVKRKLVNGSVGFIRRVDVNPDTNYVDRIYVAFQDLPDDIPITRLSANYCIGSGLFVQRTQFPLTLAYAITIHKCQGLSLRTAMVDIGDGTFNDGMAYVALSRVKTLQNLYLIKVAGYRIKCDKRCVWEYNRMYKSAGLNNEIINYNHNPEFQSWSKKVTITAQQQLDMLDQENQLQSKVQSRRVTVKKTVRGRPRKPASRSAEAVQSTSVQGRYLKFSNDDKHSCFANAVVQCLLRCKQVYTSLVRFSSRCSISAELLRLFDASREHSSAVMTTELLRQAFGPDSDFAVTSQRNCDPVEFVYQLLLKLPPSVGRLFAHTVSLEGICRNRQCRAVNVADHGADEQYLFRGKYFGTTPYTAAEVFSGRETQFNRCYDCGSVEAEFPFKADVTFPPSTKFLILECPVALGGEPIGQTLVGVKEKGMTLFGCKWNLIACVQVVDGSPVVPELDIASQMKEAEDCRHYKAYVHHENREWVCLNDGYYNQLKMKPQMKNMPLLFMERVGI